VHFLAFANPFAPLVDPIIAALRVLLLDLNSFTHSLGWSLVLFALIVKLVLWPLSQMQFKSMAEMQRVAPQVKALQAKFKGDPQRLNQETMALYKEHGVNPMAGCLPLLIQLPVLFSLYQAIMDPNLEKFKTEGWLWIGSGLNHLAPHVVAGSLKDPDMILLALYVVSMYFSVRYGTVTPSDPQQAQQQKIMAFISPVMIAFIGRGWPSALIIYWFSFNMFSMAQSIYLLRKYGMRGPVPALETAAADKAGKADKTDKTPREAARNNGKLPAKGESATAPRKKRSRR